MAFLGLSALLLVGALVRMGAGTDAAGRLSDRPAAVAKMDDGSWVTDLFAVYAKIREQERASSPVPEMSMRAALKERPASVPRGGPPIWKMFDPPSSGRFLTAGHAPASGNSGGGAGRESAPGTPAETDGARG